MADNQENNSFFEAMAAERSTLSPKEEKQGSAPEEASRGSDLNDIDQDSKFAVSPAAENTVNGIAVILFALGILAAFICLIAGAVEISDDETTAGLAIIGSGILILVVSLVQWAFLKVFVNISRNLYNIKDALREIKNK